MTGVQTCALPICFPVTILVEFEVIKNDGVGSINDYPFSVRGIENCGYINSITEGGKILAYHDKPSITLIRRPKKLETREIEIFGNVYGDCVYLYDSEEECKKHESSGCLNPDNKKIKVTYMVEV